MLDGPSVVYVPTCQQREDYPLASMLLEHLAWPALGLFIFIVLRSKIGSLFDTARERLAKGKVSVTKEGLTLEAVEEGRREVSREVFLLKMDSQQQVPQGKTPEQQLDDLAKQYLGRHPNDRWARIRAKDSLARRMGALVVQGNIDRNTLIEGRNDAKLVALAHASLLDPKSTDLPLLLQACSRADSKHVRYALAMAFARSIEEGIVTRADYFDVYRALAGMQKGADDLLVARIEKTVALLWDRS